MQDIEALTDRFILIGKGKVLLGGDLDEVKRSFSSHRQIWVEYKFSPDLTVLEKEF